MLTFTIRPAIEADCDRIGVISAARSGREPAEVAEGARSFLRERVPDGKGLMIVAEVSGCVVGFARAQWLPAPREGEAPREAEAPREGEAPWEGEAPREGEAPWEGEAPREGEAPAEPGASTSTPEGWYLSGIVVDPEWRRRGIGHALTQARIVWLRERTEIAYYVAGASNLASIALHKRFGFREVARNIVAPGVTFERGDGVLFSLDLRKAGAIVTQSMA